MSDNAYVTYFEQTTAPEETAIGNENRRSQTLSADPVGSGTHVRCNLVPLVSGEPEEDLFRASLISRMDMLIWDSEKMEGSMYFQHSRKGKTEMKVVWIQEVLANTNNCVIIKN